MENHINREEFADLVGRGEKIYQKPVLKRHGEVTKLTQTGGGGGNIDNYSGGYTYS
jgi:hypothetical protein